MTCTTMVLLILVEVTRPILVLRLVCFFSVVSAIYFFLALAAIFFLAGLAVLPFAAVLVFFLALLPAAAVFAFGIGSASPAAPVLCPLLGAAMPSSFSRITVCTRATSLRKPRIL